MNLLQMFHLVYRSLRRGVRNALMTAGLATLGLMALHAETRPAWVGNTPSAGNATYRFIEVVSYGSDVEGARIEAQKKLAGNEQLKRSVRVRIATEKNRTLEQNATRGHLNESVRDRTEIAVNIEGQEFVLQASEIDTWHRRTGGMVELHTLFQVAVDEHPDFDGCSLTNRYGREAVVRSLVPGWGQIYKGSKAKGWTIVGAGVLAVGGIIWTENERASYESKMKAAHTTSRIEHFMLKRDNFATARNVCIGAASAIYLYNLVDAVAAPGARRVSVRPRRHALVPIVTPESAQLAWTYSF